MSSPQHTGTWLAIYLKEDLDQFELTDGHLLGIMSGNTGWNYSMTQELQSTLEASGIHQHVMRIHIPCMAHISKLGLGAVMSSVGENGCTKSWEAYERNQQFGENECTDIGNSQRLRNEGNARINKVSAMRPDLAKIIEKVSISRHFGRPETDLHIADNACCIDNADAWSSKWV